MYYSDWNLRKRNWFQERLVQFYQWAKKRIQRTILSPSACEIFMCEIIHYLQWRSLSTFCCHDQLNAIYLYRSLRVLKVHLFILIPVHTGSFLHSRELPAVKASAHRCFIAAGGRWVARKQIASITSTLTLVKQPAESSYCTGENHLLPLPSPLNLKRDITPSKRRHFLQRITHPTQFCS